MLEEETRPIRSKLLSIEEKFSQTKSVVEAKLIQFDLLPSH